MFDPNNPNDDEFREMCAVGAGMVLEYIGDGESEDLESPVSLGSLVVATAALAQMQGMDLHELLGAVMSAYRGTKVQEINIEEDEDDAGDEGPRH